MRHLPRFALRASICCVLATASPAGAQSWTEEGTVEIRVSRDGGSVFHVDSEDILETDVISTIGIGWTNFSGATGEGSLSVSQTGMPGAHRDLGQVRMFDGSFSLNGSYTSGAISFGVEAGAPVTDASTFGLSLGEHLGSIVVGRRADFSCSQASIEDLTIGSSDDPSLALIASCTIDSLVSTLGADVTIQNSSLHGGTLGGNVGIRDSTIDDDGGFRIGDGDVTIGVGGPVVIDVAGQLRVEGFATPGPTTAQLFVFDTDVEAGSTLFRSAGDNTTFATLSGATLWTSLGLFEVHGADTTLEVFGGSRIDARTNFYLSGATEVTVASSITADSRIDVAGDLGVGNVDVDTFSTGVLTIEDGGVVDVDGTLFIQPDAIVNLNGGRLRVSNLVEEGTLVENGGLLIVPEAGATASAVAALGAAAATTRWLRRPARSSSRRRA
jgi:hypothetical protein